MQEHLRQVGDVPPSEGVPSAQGRQRNRIRRGAPATRLFHLAVQGTYNPDYWLHLEVPAHATLYNLDQFLRDIWLECCGHLSMFEIMGQRYQVKLFDDWWDGGERDMNVELGAVLMPGLKFTHEYDFGSSTYLTLRLVAEREGVVKKGQPVQILARNDPPDYVCQECDQSATVICVYCGYTLLCDECGETHECGDEGFLPVVNSPRMGVCGYTGDAW